MLINLSHIFFILFLLLLCNCGLSNNCFTINQLDTVIPNENINIDADSYYINFYQEAKKEELTILKKILGSSLDFYVDQSVIIADEKITFKTSEKKMIRDLNSIVKDGIKYYNFKEIKDFEGFSSRSEDKISQLFLIDLKSHNLQNIQDKRERESMIYYVVQKEMNDLKLVLNIELGNFTNENLLALVPDNGTNQDRQKTLDDILNFKKYDQLEPIDIEISDSSMSILAQKDNSTLSNPLGFSSFQDEILSLLKENNSKIESLENRLIDLESTRTQSVEALDWEKIKSLVENNYNGNNPIDNQSLVPINNLPNSVSVYFEKASFQLSMGNKLILNEIIDILAHNSRMAVIVTGYADKIGSENSNYNLSKKRAGNVQRMMLESGINPNRVMMNYFGDNKSSHMNPGDRKVVIEFVPF